MNDKIRQFPGVGGPSEKSAHPNLSEALRESVRFGFERKMNSLFAKYAVPSIADDPMAKATFLDAGLLFARVSHFLEGYSWKDAFLRVIQHVTSKPEAERPDAVPQILAAYQMKREELLASLISKGGAGESGG